MVYVVLVCFQLNKNRPETVQDVLQVLRLHVSVPQCDIFGYLSIDHMLVVLVAPVDRQPTPLQVTHTAVIIFTCFALLSSHQPQHPIHNIHCVCF